MESTYDQWKLIKHWNETIKCTFVSYNRILPLAQQLVVTINEFIMKFVVVPFVAILFGALRGRKQCDLHCFVNPSGIFNTVFSMHFLVFIYLSIYLYNIKKFCHNCFYIPWIGYCFVLGALLTKYSCFFLLVFYNLWCF